MRPDHILPDHANEVQIHGIPVRKGSVGAFLANAVALHDPAVTGAARDALLGDIEALLPALRALGLFDVFEIRDPQLRAFVEART